MTNSGKDPHRYDDLLDLPHHVSATHPHMTLYDRAAQFAPFKSLPGYEDEVAETARLTDARAELDAERIAQLDARLRLLAEHLAETPVVSITYFRPDARKDGGSYETVSGAVKKLDTLRRAIVLRDGREIRIDDVAELGGALFAALGG